MTRGEAVQEIRGRILDLAAFETVLGFHLNFISRTTRFQALEAISAQRWYSTDVAAPRFELFPRTHAVANATTVRSQAISSSMTFGRLSWSWGNA